MREVVISPKVAEETIDREPIELSVPDPNAEGGKHVITGIIPKDAILARASGVFTDKYAPNGLLARTAFDFLEASLTHKSWAYCMARLQDRDDEFDTDHITGIFEALFEEFTAQIEASGNREQRRAASRARA